MPDTPPLERRNFPTPEPWDPQGEIPDHWTWLVGPDSKGHQTTVPGTLCRCGCEETRVK